MRPIKKDPHEMNSHSPDAKFDSGKQTFAMSLGYFKNALAAVNNVSLFGARKYAQWGWIDVPEGIQRYTEAEIRHIISIQAGEVTDTDSGLSHAAHAAWNALAILELQIRSEQSDQKQNHSSD